MKYNAYEIEERWRPFWNEQRLFAFDSSSEKPLFVVDTPPPYVSADHLHAGHIMSYAQSEFIVRYKRMCGFNVYYPMGFDDNGLPTERFIEKKYAIDKSKITRPDFVKLCLEETAKGAATYKELWQTLGISVDWNYTYSTINQHSQKIAQKSFIDLYKKGHAYRAEKPVMWCTHCQTTLADADVEVTDDTNVRVHERCDTPIEYVTSEQWFIRIVDQKETWKKLGEQINWYPASRRDDYNNWVNGLSWDWCISRQRYYGVPIPVWYKKSTGEPVLPSIDELPVDPTQYTPKGYNPDELIADSDVLDTWATSSLTPQIIAGLIDDKPMRQKLYPATLRPNAFEIIRTWDFYSVVRGHYLNGELPFKDVMVSGHGLAEDGRKLSKRLGNYVPSHELLEEYGADAIRYWATGARLGQNLRFSAKEVQMGHKTAVKLFNVGQLAAMHELSGTAPIFQHADAWIMQELNMAINEVTAAYEEYAYSSARDVLDDFFWVKLADNYIEFIKYRLYGGDEASKAGAVATLRTVLLAVIKLYAPIMPFITEHTYQELYAAQDDAKSIHVSSWPEVIERSDGLDITDFADVLSAIEEIRKYKAHIGVSLGKELDSYTLNTKVDLVKYGELVGRVGRVKAFL